MTQVPISNKRPPVTLPHPKGPGTLPGHKNPAVGGDPPAGPGTAASGPSPVAPLAAAQEVPDDIMEGRRLLLADGWPIPDEDAWCHRYNTEVRERAGFYDPPDLYFPPGRAEKIEQGYPEIHAWANKIADAWYGKRFLQVASPARRNRIVAAMLFTAHHEGNPRIKGVEPFLQLARSQTTQLVVEWIVGLAEMLAEVLVVLSRGSLLKKDGQILADGARLLGSVSDLTQVVGMIAAGVEANEISDVEAAGELVSEVLDLLDDVAGLAPGETDGAAVKAMLKRVREALKAAGAFI